MNTFTNTQRSWQISWIAKNSAIQRNSAITYRHSSSERLVISSNSQDLLHSLVSVNTKTNHIAEKWPLLPYGISCVVMYKLLSTCSSQHLSLQLHSSRSNTRHSPPLSQLGFLYISSQRYVSPARHTALKLQFVEHSDSLGAKANVTCEFGCHALLLGEESRSGEKDWEREVDKAEGVRWNVGISRGILIGILPL